MDNQTAKEILSAFRPGGEDATDPIFKEALDQCENDPAMQAWFAEQRTFDERITSALQTIHAPESGKRAILEIAQAGQSADTSNAINTPDTTHRSFWQRHTTWLSVAASLAIAFIATVSVLQPQNEFRGQSTGGLRQMVAAALPLEFRHTDTNEVFNWLSKQGAPVAETLASKITDTPAAGCRIFNPPTGGKISLVCLEVDRQLVHVFIYDDVARLQYEGSVDNWWQEEGYNLIAKRNGAQLIAYATRADPSAVAHLL